MGHDKFVLPLSRSWHTTGAEPDRTLTNDTNDTAERLEDLRVPRGNHLERLSGDRKVCCSIRINVQWRICFRWHNGDAYDMEITDYH
ncbi:MAG: hypothetical protein GXP58_02900 [Deltaproteobacteria bacterium]|nr:hypothetical protein [Deltaproteobacteria bacterium]